ncbi:hypothetical protein AAFF_G00209120 [Aldrovandia affinis]|uniref:C2H2-type domain-containing protein n=1 Tax=Aldrovandia affinis TaxID=143900 RepID=A0AAD7WUE4_9TELE|nr:hypothetical protein AAFF_G00209120 [Aldrovandia affinis]
MQLHSHRPAPRDHPLPPMRDVSTIVYQGTATTHLSITKLQMLCRYYSGLCPPRCQRVFISEDSLGEHSARGHRFQNLTDHLKLEKALLVADSYSNSRYPFSDTMEALIKIYGQPNQLVLQHIAELMDSPDIASGEVKAFRMYPASTLPHAGAAE